MRLSGRRGERIRTQQTKCLLSQTKKPFAKVLLSQQVVTAGYLGWRAEISKLWLSRHTRPPERCGKYTTTLNRRRTIVYGQFSRFVPRVLSKRLGKRGEPPSALYGL